jgi:hypothetical protein
MKKNLVTIALIFSNIISFACPTCEKAQPKLFRGITHGAGPDSNWDYVIIGITAVIVLYCSYITINRIVKPKEENSNHIKNAFLN